VVRGNWELPDLDGGMHPLTHFAREMIHWTHYYEDPLDDLRGWIERSVHEGLLGYCPAFEPGFSSASFYSDDIPFPVNALPYVLTRFAYRTFTWEPHLGQAQGQPLLQFRERVRRKFFTPDAPPELTDDLLWLFDFIRTTATSTAFRPGGRWQRGERRAWLKEVETATEARAHSPDEWEQMAQWLAALLELGAAHASRLDEIAGRIEAHGPAASARTKRSLKMLRQAVTDCRTELLLRPEDATRLRAAAEKCVRLREELVGRGVRDLLLAQRADLLPMEGSGRAARDFLAGGRQRPPAADVDAGVRRPAPDLAPPPRPGNLSRSLQHPRLPRRGEHRRDHV